MPPLCFLHFLTWNLDPLVAGRPRVRWGLLVVGHTVNSAALDQSAVALHVFWFDTVHAQLDFGLN